MIGQKTDGEGKLYGALASIEPHSEYGHDIRINVYVKYEAAILSARRPCLR
jgi:hypothetical protein